MDKQSDAQRDTALTGYQGFARRITAAIALNWTEIEFKPTVAKDF